MRFFQNFSIKSKLIGIILLVTVLSLGVAFTLVIINNIKTFKKDMVNNTFVNASLFGEYCVTPMAFQDEEGAAEILQKLEAIPSIMNGYVYDERGDLFAAYNRSGNKIIPPRLDEKPAAQFEGKYLHVVQPIIYQGYKYGTIYLRASTAMLDNKIKNNLMIMMLLMAGLMLLSYFPAHRLQKVLSGPILKLASVTQEISEKGNYSVRVEEQRNDEIGILYNGFNEMLEQIQLREQERDKAEEELSKHREHLEELVKERTSELEEKTIELENEVAIREHTEMKLRTEKAYIDQLFESAQEAIVVVDKDGSVLRANNEFIRLFGYTIDEVIGASLDDLIASKEYYDKAVSVTKKVAEGEKIAFETMRQRKDGTLLNVSVLASPIIVDDELVAVYGIYRDITELKKAEKALQERSKELAEANILLKEANRLKSIFLASMSHELRTPLNSIIGFTGIILQGMSGEINEEQKTQLTMVKNSSNHLLSLINDLLDISKIEAGKVELFLEEFRLDDLVGEVVETFSPTVSEKGLELPWDIDKSITLFSDRRRVKQVLMNIVSNAVKFTDHGSVKIAGRILKDEKVEMRVTDTGIGIKKEEMNKLFKSFQQIDALLAKKHEGTGLGLYLTKKLLALLGGNISAKSEYGRGSDFTLTLPLKYEEEKGNEKNTSS